MEPVPLKGNAVANARDCWRNIKIANANHYRWQFRDVPAHDAMSLPVSPFTFPTHPRSKMKRNKSACRALLNAASLAGAATSFSQASEALSCAGVTSETLR
ncbi:hypothetical protein [Burkholderia ubonensis]|uniref:hypothetical protein n=1 Tax=Burkholderia ubonensis TaxID=101571 RepID=UPI00116023AE|nr:hypothetical protein [Burkholderia ubonensis]